MKKFFLLLIFSFLAFSCTMKYPSEYLDNPENYFEDKIINNKEWVNTKIKYHEISKFPKKEYYSYNTFHIQTDSNKLIERVYFSELKEFTDKTQYVEFTFNYNVSWAKKDEIQVNLNSEKITKHMGLTFISDKEILSLAQSKTNIYTVINCPDKLIVNGQEEFN